MARGELSLSVAVIGARGAAGGLGCAGGLDGRELLGVEREVVDREILAHVHRAAGSGEREHADLAREPEDDLRRRLAVARGDRTDAPVYGDVAVRREQRERLVDDAVLGAHRADRAIPAALGVAAVLYERRWDARQRDELAE